MIEISSLIALNSGVMAGDRSQPTEMSPADIATNAVRRLAEAVVRTANHPRAAAMAERVNILADELDSRAPSAAERVETMWDPAGGVPKHSPVAGIRNAVARPLILHHLTDGVVEGRVNFGVLHQGPPGCLHGGIAALVLDVALASANVRAGFPGVTASMRIRYLRPTPLYRELTVVAAHIDRDGRKVRAWAEIRLDGEVCVRAEGLFVTAREGLASDR